VTDEDLPTSLSVPATEEPEPDNLLFKILEEAMQYANAGNHNDALTKCHDAVKAAPSAAEPYFLMGTIAFICGDEGQAISMCEVAHKVDPTAAEYAEALATIYTSVGRLADGLYFAKIATSLEPHPLFSKRMPPRLKDLNSAYLNASPSTHFIEAQRLFNIGDFERSLYECTAEIRLNSDNLKVYILLGRTAIILGRYSQAVGALQAAIQLDPKAGIAPALLARALVHLGRHGEAIAAGKRALQQDDTDAEVYAQAMDAMLRCPSLSGEVTRQWAIDFQTRFDAENDPVDSDRADPDAPLKVGFLSNAFFRTSGCDLYQGWFQISPAKGMEYAGYQLSVNPDTITTTIKQGCTSWREVYDLDPYTLSFTMDAEELDVYVDLSYLDGDTRMAVGGMKPCPARVGAFALPEPGLAPGVTHVLSDEILSEGDVAALLPGQECVSISGSLFAQEPYSGLSQETPCPAIEKGQVTFGGIVDLAYLSPECATLWADVLHAVPQANLLLCSPHEMADEVRARVREFFSIAGVADRVLLPIDDVEEEIDELEAFHNAMSALPPAQMREVDVFLDTSPVNCRRELCQALWMGVPVVSLKGDRRPGLVGASILSAAGRLNWVAESREAFIEIASSLVSDTEILDRERRALRENIESSMLFDSKATAMNVRNALTDIARQSRQSRQSVS
jgi:protein O-GlcNAc transferase